MVTRSRLVAAATIVSIIALCVGASAEDDTSNVRPFSGVSLGFSAGLSVLETATSDSFNKSPYFGGQLGIDLIGSDYHYFVLDGGLEVLTKDFSHGTQEVIVDTSYKRFTIAAGYDLRYHLAILGVRLGTVGMMVGTRTELRNANFQAQGSDIDFFDNGQILAVSDQSGIDMGFLSRIELGLDLSHPFKGPKTLFEIRARFDLIKRGEREEIYAGGVIAFRPTALIKHEKK